MEYCGGSCARCGHKFEKNDLMYEQFIQDEKTNRPIWSGKYICDECIDAMDQEEMTKEFCFTQNDIEDSLRETLYTNYSKKFQG